VSKDEKLLILLKKNAIQQKIQHKYTKLKLTFLLQLKNDTKLTESGSRSKY